MMVEGGRLQFCWRGRGALGQTKRALNNAEGGQFEIQSELSQNRSTKAEVAFLPFVVKFIVLFL